MLCTAKSDSLCTKLTSLLSICRSICICTNLKSSELISPCHNTSELTSDRSINCWEMCIRDSAQADLIADAYKTNEDLRAIAGLYTETCQLVVRADSDLSLIHI